MMRKACIVSAVAYISFSFLITYAAPPIPSKPLINTGQPAISAISKASPKEIMGKVNPAQERPPSKAAVVFSEAEVAVKKQRMQELLDTNSAVLAISKDPELFADLMASRSFRDRYFEFESNPQTKKDIMEFLRLQNDLRKVKKQEPNFITSTRNILQAARASGIIPDGSVFRMVDAKEVEMLMRDGYVTATAYPDNPPLVSVKSDINAIVQSPQALQRALIHHDTGNGADSFVKSATVSEKQLLTTIAQYAKSYPEQYVLVLNPKRALINQFNALWKIEGEVVFPGYIELGTDVIGYMNPQTGKYISLAKNPVIKPSVVATVNAFKDLVESKTLHNNRDLANRHEMDKENSFIKSHPSPFIDPASFPKAARIYDTLPVDNASLRQIAPRIKMR